MRTVRKIFFYLSLAVAVVLITMVASVYFFKDQIINEFIREANKSLSTPVKPGKIEVSWFEDFPNLSIVFHDVYVEDSHEGQYPLLTAEVISFQLNALEAWRGKYTIKGMQIKNSETILKIDTKGKNNYTILKEKGNDGGGAAIGFELKNVKLINTKVRYSDLRARQEYIFSSDRLTASIKSMNDIYNINADGNLTTEKLKIDKTELFNGKSFSISSKLVYDDLNKNLLINPSELILKQSTFTVEGNYYWKDRSLINLKATGKNTDIQTLLSLLPESTAKSFERYQSEGDMYFNAELKGEIGRNTSPSLSVDFGFQNATLFHPEYKSRIEEANIEGSFASSHVADPTKAVLVLKNIQGKLNGEQFTANLVVNNFTDSDVILNFKGKLDAASVFDFYPVGNISDVSGSLMADVSFEGRLSWLRSKTTARKATTQGSIELQNMGLSYGKEKVSIQNLRGVLQFNNNDLALSNVSGKLGNSDVLLNGFFKNVITFLLFEDQPIGIETDLTSSFLDLDELFALTFGNNKTDAPEYEFSISRNLNLNFNCNVRALRYRRFHANDVKGDLLIKNEMAVSRNVMLKSMGGNMSFSGIVDAKNKKAIDVVSTFRLNGIHIDSVFYVFENFNQNFIEDKHLKGQGDADVNMEMTLKPNLRLFPETLIADIGVTIKNGQLNNFEPLKKLNKYLDDEGLDRVRFSDLKNEIHIENKNIYIPQMEVRTNVTSMRISGTHTFDQRIDYRVVTPLRSIKKISMRDSEGAIDVDDSGQSKLFLKITGTTDDYRVAYDTEAVKKKIISDLRQEVQELKSAFKNKGTKKQKELELEKEEYFDWEE